MTWGQLVMSTWELDRLLKHAPVEMKKDYIFNDFRMGMIDAIVSIAQSELIAYVGMILILTAFFFGDQRCSPQQGSALPRIDGIRLRIVSGPRLLY